MKYLPFLLLIIFGYKSHASGLKAGETAPLFDHLFSINEQWAHYKTAASGSSISFENDIQRIQKHLELVVSHLRNVETESLTIDQVTKRSALLDTLRNYAAASVFPTNSYHKKRTPYFIDIYNVYCAVGYLIKASGHDDLANRIHDEHNYNYIKDIKTPGLLEWADAHGFTVDELAWIQPSYRGNPLVNYAGGTNGAVRKIGNHQFLAVSRSSSVNIVIGDFTKLGNEDCNGIGYYFEEEWHCMGEGLDGTILDFESGGFLDSVGVAGNFMHNNKQYGVAFYTYPKGWKFLENPRDEEMIATAIISLRPKRVVAYYLPKQNKTELWELKDDVFTHHITLNGRVNTYGDYYTSNPNLADGIVVGGAFDSYTQISNSTQHTSHNLLMMYGKYSSETDFEPIDKDVHDTVHAIYNFGTATYIGSRCDTILGNGKNCLTKFVNGSFLPVITSDMLQTQGKKCPCEIRDVVAFKSSGLLIGGNFPSSDMGYSNTNLAIYDLLSNYFDPLGTLTGPVNSIFFDGYNYIFGGEFSDQDRFDKSLANLGKYFDPPTVVPEPSNGIAIFPNPANNQFVIQSSESMPFSQVSISTLSGQTILDQRYGDHVTQQSVDVSHLSPGLYLVSATASSGEKMISKLTVE